MMLCVMHLVLLAIWRCCRQTKMIRSPKKTNAFVEFGDVGCAMVAHGVLQGAILPSSDRGGIRVQFSKNPFSRRHGAACAEILAVSRAACHMALLQAA
jgi:hypothetical protein